MGSEIENNLAANFEKNAAIDNATDGHEPDNDPKSQTADGEIIANPEKSGPQVGILEADTAEHEGNADTKENSPIHKDEGFVDATGDLKDNEGLKDDDAHNDHTDHQDQNQNQKHHKDHDDSLDPEDPKAPLGPLTPPDSMDRNNSHSTQSTKVDDKQESHHHHDSKSSIKNFFRHTLTSHSNSSNDGVDHDRGYRSFLKKRDTHNSNTGSMENVSSVGSSNSDSSSNAHRKSSHLSLKRFLKIFKPDENGLFHNHRSKEKKEKDRKDKESEKEKARNNGHHHGQGNHLGGKKFHFLPQHPGSELYKKYTKGKLIGSGASGLVNLVHVRTDLSKVYAVKKFRPRLPNEAESDYKIKVNNEYKVGELLTHENLIKTIELVKENNMLSMFSDAEYYIIMEYCPYDFFNLVMSGLMEEKEIDCYLKQIINGVAHLHSMGLAHRDLKLDNCVVDKQGILKLIDFGSAVQFRKLIDQDTKKPEKELLRINGKTYKLLLSRGIVGSDPYLSPEVLDQDVISTSESSREGLSHDGPPKPNYDGIGEEKSSSVSSGSDSLDDKPIRGYDARKVDVWSIAIIYCCMVLRRFPWKIPQELDYSYKGFVKNRDRLFKLLPKESHDLISHMLIDKLERYLIDDVKDHEFIKSIDCCTTGNPVEGHKHHLITETELDEINRDRDRIKKLKQAGMA